MSNRTNRRSKGKNDRLHESIRVYLQMQRATTEGEFQHLLAEHDRLTDGDGKPRLVARDAGGISPWPAGCAAYEPGRRKGFLTVARVA